MKAYPCFESWKDRDGREYGFGFQQGEAFWLRFHNLGSFAARRGELDVKGFPDPGVDTGKFRDVFLHFVAPLILQRGGWESLHASAVLTRGRVVAFCGPSGRGKSTLAAAWSRRGALPYADDSVPFLIREGIALSGSIPQPLRLLEPAASRFGPAIPCHGNGSGDAEVVLNMESTLGPLGAIYYLESKGRDTDRSPHLERIPAVESFRLLLSQAQCLSLEDPACNRKMIQNYLALAGLVPVFSLGFAAGLDLLPAVLDGLEHHQQELFAF